MEKGRRRRGRRIGKWRRCLPLTRWGGSGKYSVQKSEEKEEEEKTEQKKKKKKQKKRDFSFLFLLGKRQTVGRQLHYSSFGSPGSEKKEGGEEDELGVNYV